MRESLANLTSKIETLTTEKLNTISRGGLNDLLNKNDQLEDTTEQIENRVDQLEDRADKLEVLVVDCGTISSLPKTVNTGNALNVENDMVVLQSYFSNPSAVTSDWKITTNNGSLVVGSGSGNTISGQTNLILYLMKSR